MGLISIDVRDRKLIYEQLVDNIKQLILQGDMKKDDVLPSVRSLARELGINPNTIQKAYGELERQGIIMTYVGRGSVVVTGQSELANDRKHILFEKISLLAEEARLLGMSKDEFTSLSAESWEKGNGK